MALGAQLLGGFRAWSRGCSARLELQALQGWHSLPRGCRSQPTVPTALAFSLTLKVSLEAESSKFAQPLVIGRTPGLSRVEAEPWVSLRFSQPPSSSFGSQ